MKIKRILIDDAIFLELISGEGVEIEGIKIMLEDIGFDRMIAMLEEQKRLEG